MPSSYAKRVTCKRCGKHEREVGDISWRGNCATCGPIAALANVNDLREHRGEWFDHWRKRCLAAFGVNE